MLKQALVIALLAGWAATPARADLEPGQLIDIVGNGDADPDPDWGTGVQGGPSHAFTGLTDYPDINGTITVTSQELQPPPDKKFAAEILIDYTLHTTHLSQNAMEHIEIFGVKEPGEINEINTVDSNVGVVTTDGFNIFFDADTIDIIAAGSIVQITWTQRLIPAPGAWALLGLAGLTGTRRRRR
jgi:hypothetical protein